MLSYRHAFHAGNHADVLKHLTLYLVLDYFNQKDKPYWYIDTHAGAGAYNLNSNYAKKTQEYSSGFERLLHDSNLPEQLQPYVSFIQQWQNSHPNLYPGSPEIAAQLLRSTDALRLFELHPADSKILIEHFRQKKIKAQIRAEDGFQGLISLLPPAPRRAVILIDPPYEEKHDYDKVVYTAKDGLKRFASGCFIVWYPCLARIESQKLSERLRKISPDNFLDARLMVQAPNADGFGMFGSGVFVINPPYKLQEQLQSILPDLVRILGQDAQADYALLAQIK